MHIDPISAPLQTDVLGDNSLRIILSRASDPQLCNFWIGLYKAKGMGSSHEFLEIQKLDDAFKYLSEIGLTDNQALMHSDNTGLAHRQFFLLPESSFKADLESGKALVLKTLESLGQKKAGIYLSPALLDNAYTADTLSDLVEGLAKLKTEEVYLLTTDIGVNQLLNISLRVKEHLRNRREVWIFH